MHHRAPYRVRLELQKYYPADHRLTHKTSPGARAVIK